MGHNSAGLAETLVFNSAYIAEGLPESDVFFDSRKLAAASHLSRLVHGVEQDSIVDENDRHHMPDSTDTLDIFWD